MRMFGAKIHLAAFLFGVARRRAGTRDMDFFSCRVCSGVLTSRLAPRDFLSNEY